MPNTYDVIIIGSGAGGGTLARQLAPTGKRILIFERGDWPKRASFPLRRQKTEGRAAMDAWSADPIPFRYLAKRTALERRGALVLQAKQCRNCHSLEGVGGKRGPALDTVAVGLTPDELIRQVIQGGGMPAYGKNLSLPETTALVSFLETLHPAGQAAARDASNASASRSSNNGN